MPALRLAPRRRRRRRPKCELVRARMGHTELYGWIGTEHVIWLFESDCALWSRQFSGWKCEQYRGHDLRTILLGREHSWHSRLGRVACELFQHVALWNARDGQDGGRG